MLEPVEARFTMFDWAVLGAYLALTTLLGAWLSGRQSTIRDFFLAGRKIPWWAVAGSNIATEISAVTLISVPAVIYAVNGNLTYLQFAIGAIIARVIVAVWIVPVYYEREIYSPYDYMARQLGAPLRTITSLLFMLGALLGQGVRVLLTALVLELVSGIPLLICIWLIGLAAVIWTLLGGITTVIWTDVIQFGLFLAGMLVALGTVIAKVPGGWAEIWSMADAAGKLTFWDFRTDLTLPYTFWAAILANTVICLAAYGTDQMMAQRLLCCRNPREARLATLASVLGLVTTVIAAMVGLALFAYYQYYPLSADQAAQVAERPDRVVPLFVVRELPPGVTGLIIAGIFAAAISTLDSVLVAMSQVVITGFYRPWRAARLRRAAEAGAAPPSEEREQAHDLGVSKWLVVFWAIALCGMANVAVLASAERYKQILDLALAMATYTGGTMLAAFMFAFFRAPIDWYGLAWAAPLSVLTVFAVQWHAPWAQVTVVVVGGLILVAWFTALVLNTSSWATEFWRDAPSTVWIVLSVLLAVGLCCVPVGRSDDGAARYVAVAFPWNVPIGFCVAAAIGWLVARRVDRAGPASA